MTLVTELFRLLCGQAQSNAEGATDTVAANRTHPCFRGPRDTRGDRTCPHTESPVSQVAEIIERIRAIAKEAAKIDADLDKLHGINRDLGIRYGDPKEIARASCLPRRGRGGLRSSAPRNQRRRRSRRLRDRCAPTIHPITPLAAVRIHPCCAATQSRST